MKKTFKQAFEESIKVNPNWGTYIHICRVLQESGLKRTEISKIFSKYMKKNEDYDPSERNQLVDYLVEQAKIPDFY